MGRALACRGRRRKKGGGRPRRGARRKSGDRKDADASADRRRRHQHALHRRAVQGRGRNARHARLPGRPQGRHEAARKVYSRMGVPLLAAPAPVGPLADRRDAPKGRRQKDAPLRAHRRREPALDGRPAAPCQERRRHAAPHGARHAACRPQPRGARAGRRSEHGKGARRRVPQPRPPAQGRPREPHARLAGDRSDNGKTEIFNGAVGDREKAARPIKRCGSPAIDGMRIRHNAKARAGLAGGGREGGGEKGQAAVRQEGDDSRGGDDKWATLI